MNYYDAREKRNALGGSGGWHYTCMNDGKIWPVGDCAEHEPHPTQLEAYECYTAYLLRERLSLDGKLKKTERRKCTECDVFTGSFATVDNSGYWPLCDDHRTATVVARLFGTVGSAISSW